MTRFGRPDLWIALALFALNVALTYPLSVPGDTPYRDSIEGGYAAMSRFIDAHPSPWGWNPFQYCGLPTQFLYVPALHYAVALLPGNPVYTYKLLTATFACLGPATLYLFFVFFTGSRLWAFVTAIAYTFCSPIYGLVSQADKDRGITYLPWRLHVYAKYGEGPHNAGLTLLPLALIAAWVAATGRRYWHLFALAILMAAITLTNWIAGLALAITCILMMVAAMDVAEFRSWRLLAAAGLAYGMACFWITPTFVRTITLNWPTDAFNYNLQAAQYRSFAILIVLMAGLYVAFRFLRWPFWEKFVSLSMVAFAYPVLLYYGKGIDLIPESRRYALEFEMLLILAAGAFLRFAFRSTNAVRKGCGAVAAIALAVAGLSQTTKYVTESRAPLWPVPVKQTSEYQIARWIAEQNPQGRVLASGGLRFRLNSWFDVAQVGGAFESGLRNRTPVHFAYHIRTDEGSVPGSEMAASMAELKALAVEYVVVHGPRSTEHYRDYKNATKFEGVLEKVYESGDDVAYRVPFNGLAHAIYPHEGIRLASYVAGIEDPTRPQLVARWLDPNRLRVEGAVPEGMQMSVQVSYDPGWSATSAGRSVPVESDQLGFIKLRGSGSGPVELHYEGTAEQKLFGALSLATWVGAAILLGKNVRVAT